MKALLRKDFYQLRAYCKSYLLICAAAYIISWLLSIRVYQKREIA